MSNYEIQFKKARCFWHTCESVPCLPQRNLYHGYGENCVYYIWESHHFRKAKQNFQFSLLPVSMHNNKNSTKHSSQKNRNISSVFSRVSPVLFETSYGIRYEKLMKFDDDCVCIEFRRSIGCESWKWMRGFSSVLCEMVKGFKIFLRIAQHASKLSLKKYTYMHICASYAWLWMKEFQVIKEMNEFMYVQYYSRSLINFSEMSYSFSKILKQFHLNWI